MIAIGVNVQMYIAATITMIWFDVVWSLSGAAEAKAAMSNCETAIPIAPRIRRFLRPHDSTTSRPGMVDTTLMMLMMREIR
jgi:hypothetical protein